VSHISWTAPRGHVCLPAAYVYVCLQHTAGSIFCVLHALLLASMTACWVLWQAGDNLNQVRMHRP
jgi:hypothetical protein